MVAQQVASGIDIVSDGEMSKLAYTLYVRHRLSGMGATPRRRRRAATSWSGATGIEHPDYVDRNAQFQPRRLFPAASGR